MSLSICPVWPVKKNWSKARAYIFPATTLQIPALWLTVAGELSGSDPWARPFWPEPVLITRAFYLRTGWGDWLAKPERWKATSVRITELNWTNYGTYLELLCNHQKVDDRNYNQRSNKYCKSYEGATAKQNNNKKLANSRILDSSKPKLVTNSKVATGGIRL